jgi:electron transport complex protein RnfB
MNLLLPVIIVSAIGVIAGIGLALASHFMSVPTDERVAAVRDALPGANCGACGFSGCDGYAAAVAAGNAATNLCAPGGADAAAKIAAVMGVEAGGVVKKTAVVHCKGSLDNTHNKYDYRGIATCAAANMLHSGPSACAYGCIGLGDCAAVCEFGALSVQNGLARVDKNKCTGCGKCAAACPKHLITVGAYDGVHSVLCRNCDKGAQTRKVCGTGCIGCMKCTKVCPVGAVTVENFVASIDPAKCTGCGICAEACPQGIIS